MKHSPNDEIYISHNASGDKWFVVEPSGHRTIEDEVRSLVEAGGRTVIRLHSSTFDNRSDDYSRISHLIYDYELGNVQELP